MSIKSQMTHWQVIRHRPLEHALALIVMLTAALSVLSGGASLGGHSVAPMVAFLWSVFGLAGGAAILGGLHLHRRSTAAARRVEQAGWEVSTLLLVGGPLVILWFDPSAWPGLLDEAFLAGAFFLRSRSLAHENQSEGERLALLAEEG